MILSRMPIRQTFAVSVSSHGTLEPPTGKETEA